jgi:hypothetical protein
VSRDTLIRAPQFYLVLTLAAARRYATGGERRRPDQALFYSRVLKGLIASFLILLLLCAWVCNWLWS